MRLGDMLRLSCDEDLVTAGDYNSTSKKPLPLDDMLKALERKAFLLGAQSLCQGEQSTNAFGESTTSTEESTTSFEAASTVQCRVVLIVLLCWVSLVWKNAAVRKSREKTVRAEFSKAKLFRRQDQLTIFEEKTKGTQTKVLLPRVRPMMKKHVSFDDVVRARVATECKKNNSGCLGRRATFGL